MMARGRFSDAADGSLPPPPFDPSVYLTLDIRCGDLDLDGWNDLLGASQGHILDGVSTPTGALAYWRNNGNGTFRDASRMLPRLWPMEVFPLRVHIADLNGDAWPDVLVDSNTGSGEASRVLIGPGGVLINRGDGSFADLARPSEVTSHQRNTVNLNPLDADGDGDIDILLFRISGGEQMERPSILFNQLDPPHELPFGLPRTPRHP